MERERAAQSSHPNGSTPDIRKEVPQIGNQGIGRRGDIRSGDALYAGQIENRILSLSFSCLGTF